VQRSLSLEGMNYTVPCSVYISRPTIACCWQTYRRGRRDGAEASYTHQRSKSVRFSTCRRS